MVLSFSTFKLRKSFQENVLEIHALEMATTLDRKVSMVHVLGEYLVTDFFQGNLK